MNPILRTLGITLICGSLVCPAVNADNRGRGRGGSPAPTHSPASRPSSSPSTRPGGGSQRPGNSGRPGNNGRPNGSGNQNRPGNSGNHNRPTVTPTRPGNNHNRPDRPSNNWRPGNDRPGGPGGSHDKPRPPKPNHHGHHGPMRPHMRPHAPFFRPTPPPSWRPAVGWRPIRSILGISLGTAFNISVNALINNGYSVSSYGDNQIYLNNVPMLNLMWPDAVMYYNSGGALYGSQFIYSTPGYNMNRYNMAYTSLTSAYGAPVSIQNLSNGIEATWWGAGNQFIRLSYVSDYANNGLIRYYTTLSFGN